MTFSQRIAGDLMAICLVWLCYALAAPIIAGPLPKLRAEHHCPWRVIVHGVGHDLKTYLRIYDRCAQQPQRK